ncbi:MAG: tRNA preQ1(34) S-adenosylmethionine ribosyltransferase-isomerase QueA [Rhizobiales bacterium PAR1]|nr:MAG: tRNA preQ1(34) S-adenosylmethionine ribosyltransferase-isomerase QueA [Rhizobiales bacterium PAR1]
MHTLADYDFHLPEERIALHPASPRDSSRLLVVRSGATPELSDHIFADLVDQLSPGDLLVFNDTKVIPARLLGTRIREENRIGIEALLIKRLDESIWEAFAKPGKRLKPGDKIVFGEVNPVCLMGHLVAEVMAKGDEGIVTLRFDRAGAFLDEAIALVGGMPLPPYILEARKRLGDANASTDAADYQTIFAAKDGAVAAPTASLHFTPDLIKRLDAKGIGHVFVTLHVGAGTFLPVKVDDLDLHKMHAEWGEVSAKAATCIREVRARGGRVIAVGTTACRLIESAAASGTIAPFVGETDIFIRPGYRFRTTDALITNFHLPKSTLLMLVSALAGFETMRRAYAHAIAESYRFYSYGDGSLLFPEVP